MKWSGNKQQGQIDIETETLGGESSTIKRISVDAGTTVAKIREALNVPESYATYRPKTKEQLVDSFEAGTLENGEKLEFSPVSKMGILGL